MRHHTIVIKGVGTSACDEEVEDSTWRGKTGKQRPRLIRATSARRRRCRQLQPHAAQCRRQQRQRWDLPRPTARAGRAASGPCRMQRAAYGGVRSKRRGEEAGQGTRHGLLVFVTGVDVSAGVEDGTDGVHVTSNSSAVARQSLEAHLHAIARDAT